jgi:hypothetical protein
LVFLLIFLKLSLLRKVSFMKNATKTPRLRDEQSYEIQYIKLCEPLCHCTSYITLY